MNVKLFLTALFTVLMAASAIASFFAIRQSYRQTREVAVLRDKLAHVHREWEPGMPLLTQQEVDNRRHAIDWLRDLPPDQWPTIKVDLTVLPVGIIQANRIEAGSIKP